MWSRFCGTRGDVVWILLDWVSFWIRLGKDVLADVQTGAMDINPLSCYVLLCP